MKPMKVSQRPATMGEILAVHEHAFARDVAAFAAGKLSPEEIRYRQLCLFGVRHLLSGRYAMPTGA